jgi:purine-nucleoside/S-methyl-5'-thioadenosine phosphorylase / adenosine deaminase
VTRTTPAGSAAFVWRETTAGRVLVARPLEPFASHVFTTRELSFLETTEEDDYRRVASAVGSLPGDILRVRQVHGRAVVRARSHPNGRQTPMDADALVSTDSHLAVSVRMADCVPLLVADRRRRVVAAVHAGWRGTLAGVTPATIEAIRREGVPAEDLIVALGPSIGPCCYQVDEPVRAPFLASDPDAARWFASDGSGRWHLDLWQAHVDQLIGQGVPANAIHVARVCTAHHLDVCYSYRREGAETGRMVAAIRLLDGPPG